MPRKAPADLGRGPARSSDQGLDAAFREPSLVNDDGHGRAAAATVVEDGRRDHCNVLVHMAVLDAITLGAEAAAALTWSTTWR